MEQESIYVGIDVAKAQVDIAVRPTGQRWAISYDESGVRELVSRLKTLKPAMVLLEASGGLELPLVAALASAALPVVVVNPRQVRDFARATGTLAKTDALDAAVLAHFADSVRPTVRPLRDAKTQVLNSLVARRHQVVTMLVSEKNRLGTAISAVRPRIEAHIAWLEQELDDLDEGLRKTLRSSPVWREKDDLLRTVPGVGEQLSLTLLAYLPELGTLDRRQVAALAGVAPSTGTAAPCVANGPSGADGRECGPPSTWGRCPRPAATPSFETSIRGYWPPVSRRSWPSSRVCADCSSPSTPCSNIALLGGTCLWQLLLISLDFQHSCCRGE